MDPQATIRQIAGHLAAAREAVDENERIDELTQAADLALCLAEYLAKSSEWVIHAEIAALRVLL